MNIVRDVERICPQGGEVDGGDLVCDVPGVSEAGDQLELQEPGDVDHEAEEERGQGVHQDPGHAGARELQLAVGQGSENQIKHIFISFILWKSNSDLTGQAEKVSPADRKKSLQGNWGNEVSLVGKGDGSHRENEVKVHSFKYVNKIRSIYLC